MLPTVLVLFGCYVLFKLGKIFDVTGQRPRLHHDQAECRSGHQCGRGSKDVAERVPHVFPSNGHNARYLRTKATRSGHFL